jgi:hypothetical protein
LSFTLFDFKLNVNNIDTTSEYLDFEKLNTCLAKEFQIKCKEINFFCVVNFDNGFKTIWFVGDFGVFAARNGKAALVSGWLVLQALSKNKSVTALSAGCAAEINCVRNLDSCMRALAINFPPARRALAPRTAKSTSSASNLSINYIIAVSFFFFFIVFAERVKLSDIERKLFKILLATRFYLYLQLNFSKIKLPLAPALW